ncbi:MAG: FAD binding domain-containing protein [Treponema sp.]|jgi:CO/xanthine dehydrogenase FAD-binding subunit|nr:FAD binding domain-containing protein [Treponema sp.]
MDNGPSQVFYPSSFQEFFSSWNRFPDAVPYAGGTDLIRSQGKRATELPRNILCLDRMDDLRKITRTERYLEIGAAVRLNDIISLGKVVPGVLTKTLEGIADPQIRSLATIGGNLCNKSRRLDASVPMAALEARYELKTASESRWISASRFSARPGLPALGERELLTRIRIPLEHWNYSMYRKFKSPGVNESGGVIVLVMKIQKNILTEIRIVYSRNIILQDRSSEALLAGKQLPLTRKAAEDFFERWRRYLEEMGKGAYSQEEHLSKSEISLLKIQIMNFIEKAILEISD